jgi:hypothetical protein
LESAARAFLSDKGRANLSPATLHIYEDALLDKRTAIWREDYGITSPADVNADMLRKYQLELYESGLAASTIHITHRVFKTFLRWLESEGIDIDRRAANRRAVRPRRPGQGSGGQVVRRLASRKQRYHVVSGAGIAGAIEAIAEGNGEAVRREKKIAIVERIVSTKTLPK